jgi:cubilin
MAVSTGLTVFIYFLFARFMKMDLISLGSNCDYDDYVAVYDGGSTASPLIGRFCGNTVPETIFSSTNRMMLNMVTNSYGAGEGFAAGYYETFGKF